MSVNIHPLTPTTTPPENANLPALLRWKDVQPIVGICRSHAHQLAAKGQFPKPRKLVKGGRASAWVYSEIIEWVESRIAATDSETN